MEQLVRSEESCRVDLLKWGARWQSNKSRPYFEGHERADVVEARESFVNYFLDNQHLYHHPIKGEDGWPKWIKPNPPIGVRPRIVLAHDESTYRSGEIPAKRWFFPGHEPFFNKGRGRSIMVSGFLVQYDSLDVFKLSEEEWKNAIK